MNIKQPLKKYLPPSSNTFMSRMLELENQIKSQAKLLEIQQEQNQSLLLKLSEINQVNPNNLNKMQEALEVEINKLKIQIQLQEQIQKEKDLKNIRKLEFDEVIFSIIIPVYNVELHLEECLNSIFTQTLHYSSFEVICVDDGSTDRSQEILKEYSDKYCNLTILYQEHKFAGAARNYGVTIAKGNYILFMDSDDFIENNLLEEAYFRIQYTQAEVILIDADIYNHIDGNFLPLPSVLQEKYLPNKLVFSEKDIPEHIFNISSGVVWNKFIKKSLIDRYDIKFPNFRTSQDVPFVFSIMALAKTITIINKVFYHLRRGHGTNLAASRDLSGGIFFTSYHFLQSELQRFGVYERLKRSFVNRALTGCMYGINNFTDSKARMDMEQLFINKYSHVFEIFDKDGEYFYPEYKTNYINYIAMKKQYNKL
ncbi:MAG: hypothetical protein ATN36_00960 [Epulopiscium sp. Nele67-Bin005]|nr:MAG: hypothetical protein ATN36_00960 [Epulopiscium sp. Nele67-Bin005]